MLAVGLSHRTAPVDVRERVAFRGPDLTSALERLRSLAGIDEAVLLSTCNRVEVHACASDAAAATGAIAGFLSSSRGIGPAELAPYLYTHADAEAVRHLYRVAAGLDAMVVGETEILGQVKEAYLLAVQGQTVGKRLNPLFQSAFRTAKEIHSRTRISQRKVSVPSVAVDLAAGIFSDFSGTTALVIGGGEMARLTAEHLAARGVAGVRVVNRSLEKARELARSVGGEGYPLEALETHLPQADIVVSATDAPHAVVRADAVARAMAKRRHRPIFLIDIAVPRDIDPEAGRLDGAYLYNIDDLERVVTDNLREREKELGTCEQILSSAVDAYLRRVLAADPLDDAIRSLQGTLDRVAAEELDQLWKKLPDLPPGPRREVEAFAQRLAAKIVSRPAARLRDESLHGDGHLLAEALRKLFPA